MTLAGMPTVALRCSFDTPPLSSGTFSYATLTPRLLSFTTSRGRQSELEPFDTGQATFELKDDDRVLDPANTAGTYYGRLLPRRRMQLEATYAGTVYPICDVYNTNWKPEWNSKHARHGIQATDAFELFANDTFTNGTYESDAVTRSQRAAEVTSARIGWIADQFGWPSGRRDISTGQVVAQPFAYEAQNTLEGMRDMEQAEGGFLFMGTTGNLTFRDKYARLAGTVQAVFGDQWEAAGTTTLWAVQLTATNSGGSDIETKATYVSVTSAATWTGEIRYRDWDYEPQDTEHLLNHVSVKRANQTAEITHEFTDASSAGTFTPTALTRELWANAEVEAESRAEYFAFRYATPAVRVRSITVSPRSDPDRMWPAVLRLDIGDRVRVKQRFYGTGSTLSHDAYVEGVRHDASPGDWQTTFLLSPVVPSVDDTTYWVFDSARFDIDTRLVF